MVLSSCNYAQKTYWLFVVGRTVTLLLKSSTITVKFRGYKCVLKERSSAVCAVEENSFNAEMWACIL